MYKEENHLNWLKYFFFIFFIVILCIGAIFNIFINYLGKNESWDLYPYAEVMWVIFSIIITLRTKSLKGLILAVILFQFLDSFVDLVAMGHHSWWGGPPILIEWQWAIVDTEPLLRQYWFYTWILQVPIRSITLALNVSNLFKKKVDIKYEFLVLLLIFLGLYALWFSSPQDFLFYFVWYGLYDPNFHYFFYLDPKGTWNLYNMLFFRVPLGIGVCIVLILTSRKISFLNEHKSNKLI